MDRTNGEEAPHVLETSDAPQALATASRGVAVMAGRARATAGRRARVLGPLLVLVSMIALGCAPKQRVPLRVGPAPVELFVDGARLESVPPELELRADRDHKIFVKREGFRPELVVLETRETGGAPRLYPGQVDVSLSARADGHREVVIEEVDEAPGPP